MSTAVHIEFEIHVKMVKVATKKEETKKIWVPMTTVYGGDNGIKSFFKHKIIEMVYAYEDSDWEIQSIIIISFTSNKETTNNNQF